MALTNMKQSKETAKKGCMPCEADSYPRYPYGLELRLENESLKKLGIKTLPAVGEEMIVVAVGVVTDAGEHANQSGTRRNLTIQLQQMDVGPMTEKDAVDAVTAALKE
jgi:hypothetical protein